MALTLTKTPYEFLARWDDAGSLKGAHIVFIERVMDGLAVVSAKYGEALPVAIAGNAGFPLSDVLSELQSSALVSVEDKAAKITQMAADHAAALQAADAETAKARADAAKTAAERDTLQAELNELRPAPINGVPQEVTMRQAQLVMLATPLAGGGTLLDAVDAAIAAIEDPLERRASEITWTKSSVIRRDHPLIIQLSAALGLTSEEIDSLFVAAAKL